MVSREDARPYPVYADSLSLDAHFWQGKNNLEASTKIGTVIAERAKAAGIEECYFDRGGFLFHGGVKALADAARDAGLKF